MQLTSDFKEDKRTKKPHPGAYEWWYFDAIDLNKKYKLVVIFYEGNPFSTQYIQKLGRGNNSLARQHPAISISLYEENNPIYYSFTEFEEKECFFGDEEIKVKVGTHHMVGQVEEGKLTYTLELDETLPSGNAIKGRIIFTGESYSVHPLEEKSLDTSQKVQHKWNLIQPHAQVEVEIEITQPGKSDRHIIFNGTGYHDHNLGMEPLKNEFRDWYWGRFHFSESTLVYYVMNRKNQRQHRAWLIDNQSFEITETYDDINLSDFSYSLFGLKTARKVLMSGSNSEITVQLSDVLDSGPFYQRFTGEAFLSKSGSGKIEKSSGMAEYIFPARIYQRLFWPLVNMRIRYKKKGAHWVQKSNTLFRWTW